MIIGEGDARHAVENEIRPFATCLSGFSLSVSGLNCTLDPSISMACRAGLACNNTLRKDADCFVVARLFGEALQTSLRTGVILANGGEFSLMLLSVSSTSVTVAEEFAGPLLLAME
ncbi:hypothetical protein [Brucella rhizosphaerae]|uniref:hypothetical protein n=1 Tax=Brucella rhizosphaerae TaxID=571254 RepID=UPI00366CF382